MEIESREGPADRHRDEERHPCFPERSECGHAPHNDAPLNGASSESGARRLGPVSIPARRQTRSRRHSEDKTGVTAGHRLDTVFLGDAREMLEVADESVDLVVTSPPYFNIKDYSLDGHQTASHSDRHASQLGDITAFDAFLAELTRVWKECARVLRPNGKLIINTPLVPMLKRDLVTHENRHIFDLNAEIQQTIVRGVSGMFLMDTYVWNRTNPTKRLMFGSYPYPPNFYAQNTVEFVTVYVKAGKARRRSVEVRDQSKLSQDEWVEYTKQVWDIPIPNKSDLAFGHHSALMPEELARRCIRLYSCVGDVVLDPFAGSGTTCRVAQEQQRHFIGYELVHEYAALINEKVGRPVCVRTPKRRARPKQPQIEATPAPPHLLNRVHVRDALDLLRELPPACIDLACIDPPYNLGKGDWDSWPTDEAFLDFTRQWIDELLPALVPGGALFIFNTPRNSAHILSHLETRGLSIENWITWDKRDGFSATRRRFVPMQETIVFARAPGGQRTFNADLVREPYQSSERINAAATKGILKNGKRWFPNPKGRMPTDVWHFASERHRAKVKGRIQTPAHPTQKPTALIERIVLATTQPGDVVLDCFAGTGTTAVVAAQHSRHFVACDLDAAYVDQARLRLAELEEAAVEDAG